MIGLLLFAGLLAASLPLTSGSVAADHQPEGRARRLTGDDLALVRELQGKISPQRIHDGLSVFAPLDRISGGDGERRAADYLVSELEKAGVPHRVHELRLYLSWPVRAQLRAGGRTMKAVTPAFSASAPQGATGEAVFAGKLVSESIWTGYTRGGLPVGARGKVVVIDGLIEPQEVERAAAAGAIAVVFVNTGPLLHEMIATPVWGTPTPASAARMPRIPVVSIAHQDGEALRALARSGALQVTVIAETSTAWRAAPLVTAEVTGARDEFVLISSHLDAWYSGMSDTGGTDVTLLELARLLQGARPRLQRSIRFAWWVGHSTGRYAGSTWYADHFWADLDRRCVGYVNLDGPGTRGSPPDVASSWAWPELLDFTDDLARELTGREPVHEYVSEQPDRIRPPRAGDSSFQGLGVPEFSVGIAELPAKHPDRRPYVGGSQGAWWWHTRDDTVDKLDESLLRRDLEWRIASLVALANARVLPYRISAIAGAYEKVLDELARVAGERFDLSGTQARARVLRELAVRVEEAPVPAGTERAHNRALLGASHRLNAALYTAAGRVDQDPATPLPLLPLLDPVHDLAGMPPATDQARFLETQLLRSRNRVDATLDEAAEILRAVFAR